MEHPLIHPLKLGKTTISKLTFREYTTAEDYLSFDKRGGVSQRIALISSLTGMDEAVILQLRGPDYVRCAGIADKMLAEDEEIAYPKPAEGTSEQDVVTGKKSES